MKINKKFKIESAAAIKILFMVVLLLPFLSACRMGEGRNELTNYTGDSVKTFQRNTKIKLEEESNGVYSKEGVLQLIAPKGKISSVTLLKEAEGFSLYGIRIGMNKVDAERILYDKYEKEASKTIDSVNSAVKYSFKEGDDELYVSYDIDTETVVELSYYHLKEKDEKQDSINAITAGELISLIGNTRVYYNEVMVYLKSVQQNYESEYGKDIWDADIFGNGKSFGEQIKEEVLKQITELKIIKDKAEEYDIILSEEELAQAKNYAREHFEGLSDKDVDQYHITEELLQQVYADNILAEKVFETITIDVDTNVSDLEAKQITVQHISIYNTDFDVAGNKIPLSVEERQKAFEKVNSLYQQAKETQDFLSLAEANTEAENVELTFGRGQAPEEYSGVFEQAAFTLRTGEISDIITTDYGWHIIYCVTDFNEDATTQVKENIIDERRTKMFSELYSEWSGDYDIVVNSEAWNAVSFAN